jgi:hypothetical protein
LIERNSKGWTSQQVEAYLDRRTSAILAPQSRLLAFVKSCNAVAVGTLDLS